jgi:hypothetical protein
MSHWGGLAEERTNLFAGEAGFPVRWIQGGGEWKVATTGRLESPPYVTEFMPEFSYPEVSQI